MEIAASEHDPAKEFDTCLRLLPMDSVVGLQTAYISIGHRLDMDMSHPVRCTTLHYILFLKKDKKLYAFSGRKPSVSW